jgi:hypothetical protein
MKELQRRLDELLSDLAELERCAACGGDGSGNASLVIIAKRGTRSEIAEVRRLMTEVTFTP